MAKILRSDQYRIADDLLLSDEKRIAVLSMGRRWGKTTLGEAICWAMTLASKSVAWVAPSHPQARTLWRAIVLDARRVGAKLWATDRIWEFRGGTGRVFSAEAETVIRGNAFDLVVVDEAARIPEDVWQATITPTMADYDGRALLISTPKGKNWFWREWMRGRQGDPLYSAWKAPSKDNPMPTIQRAYEQARERLPARVFAQEWDAEFVDDSGGVFVGVRQRARDVERKGDVVLAVDLGRDEDYTAVAAFDTAQQAVLWVRRWRGLPYTETTRRIAELAREVGAREVAVESNAMGAAVADYLMRYDVPVATVTTTRASKQRIVEQLAAAIEHGEITLPNDDYVLTELENFTAHRRADGSYEYSAPAGLHDDCVMAVAWAYDRGRYAGIAVEVW